MAAPERSSIPVRRMGRPSAAGRPPAKFPRRAARSGLRPRRVLRARSATRCLRSEHAKAMQRSSPSAGRRSPAPARQIAPVGSYAARRPARTRGPCRFTSQRDARPHAGPPTSRFARRTRTARRDSTAQRALDRRGRGARTSTRSRSLHPVTDLAGKTSIALGLRYNRETRYRRTVRPSDSDPGRLRIPL